MILIEAMELCVRTGIKSAKFHCDSMLVVKQILGEYRVNKEAFKVFIAKIETLFAFFTKIEVVHVPRQVMVDLLEH